MKILSILFLFTAICLYSQVPDNLSDRKQWDYKNYKGVEIYTKKDSGRIPILCFHKIGSEPRYEITSENFEKFLIYLNKNNFYLLSDKEFANNDFSMVPSGFKPIIMGSDDASEGNFLYKTISLDSVNGQIEKIDGESQLLESTMVSLLKQYIKPANGRINFTFYVSFNGIPFRQTGGSDPTGEYYRGLPVVQDKFNYIIDNFILGIHTVTHPVTKNTAAKDFKWEIDEFYSILESYVDEKIELIDTLAYPYGCADINPELRSMVKNYNYKGIKIRAGFDFNGYFCNSPFTSALDYYDISRLGVDNQNIDKVYGFLENIKLFKSERVIVYSDKSSLDGINYVENDKIILGES